MELFYNSKIHKVQSQVKSLSKEEQCNYILDKWVSKKLHSRDLIATNKLEPFLLIDAKFMFIKKFLSKRNKRL